MENKIKSVVVWFGVNKNSDIRMFLDEEPKKDLERGILIGKNPFVNSVLYEDLKQVVKNAKMTFNSEPQCIEIQIS